MVKESTTPTKTVQVAAKKNLYDKIWQQHCVETDNDGSSLLYVDRHILHEVSSAQAFEGLRAANRQPRRSGTVLATADHQVPTTDRHRGLEGFSDQIAKLQVVTLEENCSQFGIRQFSLTDQRQGIVHVVGAEQGAILPGMTVVCGDSHTSTHGAFAALAQGIGTSEVEHVLASQCLVQTKSKSMLVQVDGSLTTGITAKDLILHIVGKIGSAGGNGYVTEYAGEAIRGLSMEGRMTLCNMTIEAGARAGMIAFDRVTENYLRGRPFAPKGKQWQLAVTHWQTMYSDEGAKFDKVYRFDVRAVVPQVTWGTKPEQVVAVDGWVPDPEMESDPVKRNDYQRALAYMGLKAGTAIRDISLDRVFIGSCTNGRIEDIREVARILKDKHIASGIKEALVVPGSGLVKAQAEAEGLHKIIQAAGFQWRHAGCSMCNAMNPDYLNSGERCASTSNRNFEGRQGKGGRTHLVSPAMAAAAAINGRFVDVREVEKGEC